MNYIIDGHNLIAKIPGMSLSMPDDEEKLISLLNRFGEHNRGKLEVYFDNAPTGQAGMQTYGRVQARFVPANQTADDAIRARLALLGRSARNWVVVTSDRSVRAAALEVHAGVIRSEDFSRLLQGLRHRRLADLLGSSDHPLSQAEVEEWLAIYKIRRNPK